ncbi:M67 family metallopeptidase [Salinisphaera sp. USBA-960]|uniref:M67 family metallopeptidase n=1 Tax=Salinisphaera orenii TaxID=856731 RepID=UPI000DBE8D6E|nr:M67 family metallopeptidase [Salifodinibacter halophilus]NNC25455.1 M67 family metallopeptidase [Salifodinibacter halophilus]
METLKLSPSTTHELLNAANAQPLVEICGVIAREGNHQDTIYPIANVHPDPARAFTLDARDQIAAFKSMRHAGSRLLAVYHSHPDQPAEPSAADRAGVGYPDAFTLIISPTQSPADVMRAWRLGEHGFVEVKLRVSN